MSKTTNTVLQRGPARFTMAGQRLPYNLHDTAQTISAGLVSRLSSYAFKRMAEYGFDVAAWDCEVCTMDGDLPPSERFYIVEFTNPKGGQISITGILTSNGWPCLDHGFAIDTK